MNLTASAQATLLLTSYFSSAKSNEHKPLSNAEWGKFAMWLKLQRISPADLLIPAPETLLNGWNDGRISVERIVSLLGRGNSLALAVEKWHRAGLWIITRADADYPLSLKSRLRSDSPPVLFGCGNRALLQKKGIAIIGSRNAVEEDLLFTAQLASTLANQQVMVVSGGARGVDECAMLSALDAGGTSVGVLTDSLLKASTSSKWRQGLMSGNLVLISPFYPESGFSVANAMARNKYVYCLADSAMVIHAGMKGGTVTGALEALKNQWVPVWVKPTQDALSANALLVQKGGRWSTEQAEDIDATQLQTIPDIASTTQPLSQPELFSLQESTGEYLANTNERSVDFFSLFVQKLHVLAAEPVSTDTLLMATKLVPEQLAVWLHRAEEENVIRKLPNSGKYLLCE